MLKKIGVWLEKTVSGLYVLLNTIVGLLHTYDILQDLFAFGVRGSGSTLYPRRNNQYVHFSMKTPSQFFSGQTQLWRVDKYLWHWTRLVLKQVWEKFRNISFLPTTVTQHRAAAAFKKSQFLKEDHIFHKLYGCMAFVTVR